MGKPLPSARDKSAALLCAEAFQRVAEPFLPKIAGNLEEGTQSPPRNVGDLVAAAANLAFAVELYIKTLLAELQINVPRGHNLGELYAQVPQSVRDEIGRSYTTSKKDWYGRRASITIAKGPTKQPKWDHHRSESQDLGALLSRSGDVFSSWRYIYEFTVPDQGDYQFHQFEYGLLLSACQAMRDTIKRLRKSRADTES